MQSRLGKAVNSGQWTVNSGQCTAASALLPARVEISYESSVRQRWVILCKFVVGGSGKDRFKGVGGGCSSGFGGIESFQLQVFRFLGF